jgi:hypothetical protein
LGIAIVADGISTPIRRARSAGAVSDHDPAPPRSVMNSCRFKSAQPLEKVYGSLKYVFLTNFSAYQP